MRTARRRPGGIACALLACVCALALVAAPHVARAQDAAVTDVDVDAAAEPVDAAAEPVDASAELEPSPTDDRAAQHALGGDDADAPDPVAEEGERAGSAEGEPVPDRAPVAMEIAALSDRACLRALERAHVPFARIHGSVAGVAEPVRVTGAIGGVRYQASDRHEIHELMDCRLAVALVRFSRLLRPLGIVEVRHYSTYRPPDDRAVARQRVQARHGGGLAIDAAWFVRQDGARFGVERDFHGRRGRPVCGPEARVPHHEGARLLRTIACDAARHGLFTVILTPNYNYPHRNHFHLEITRGATWRAVR